jgi:hypothetical protein
MNWQHLLDLKFLSSPFSLTFAIFLTSCWIFFIIYLKTQHFTTSDKPTDIKAFTPKQHLEFQNDATIVKAGMLIKNISEFNITTNIVNFDAILWFEFNPTLLRSETIDNFSFINGEILDKKIILIRKTEDQLLIEYDVKVKITSNFDHTFFPFNDHKFDIVLTNDIVSSNEIIFQVSDSSFIIAENIKAYDRKIVGKSVKTGYRESFLEEKNVEKIIANPLAVFTLNFARAGLRQLSMILTPIFLLMFIGYYSFSLDPEKYASPVLSLSGLSVTGLLAYRYVIEVLSPKVGYFTLSDHIYTVNLLISCYIFIISVIQFIYLDDPQFIKMLKSICFLTSQLFLICILYYLLFFWKKSILLEFDFHDKKHSRKTILDPYELNQQFESLSQIKLHASQFEEYPEIDNQDLLNPEYTTHYKKMLLK